MTGKPVQRKYWRESDARAFVEEHAASGMTIAAFAAARGIVPQRLKRWRKRLGIRAEMAARSGRAAASTAPAVVSAAPAVVRIARVERVAPSTAPTGAALTIELGRARVVVPAGFDAQTVRAVVDAVVAATHGGAR